MVSEEVQNPNPTGHLHLRFDLQRRADSVPVHSLRDGGDRSRQGEWLDRESGGHVLRLAGVDFAGGNEHESNLRAGVEELERAVVVRERGFVRVSDGDVLRESEIDGAVGDGERRQLDGGDGDLRILRLEDGEEDDEDDDDDEYQENRGDYTGRQVRAAGRRVVAVRFAHGGAHDGGETDLGLLQRREKEKQGEERE